MSFDSHLTLQEMETISRMLIQGKNLNKISQTQWTHLLQCELCFHELQESILDLNALEVTHQMITEAKRKQWNPFNVLVQQLEQGFEILKSNLQALTTSPMPLYRTSDKKKSALEYIQFLLFFKQFPIRITLKIDILKFVEISFYGLPKEVKTIAIKKLENDTEHLISEFSTSRTEHKVQLSQEQIFNIQKQKESILGIFSNDQPMGQIKIIR